MMNGWNMSGWGWGGMTIMVVIGVMLLVLLVKSLTRLPEAPPPDRPENALDLLRRRFAAGEIDEDEFHKRRDALGSP